MAIQTKTMTVKSDTALAETTTTIRDTVTFDVSKMPNGITYKGLKAVLSFADPIQWNKASMYAPLTVVWDDATHASYASKRPVPQNIELTNEFYWLRTADLDAQVEMYRQEVRDMGTRIDTLQGRVNDVELKETKYTAEYIGLKSYETLEEANTAPDAVLKSNSQLISNIEGSIVFGPGYYPFKESISMNNTTSFFGNGTTLVFNNGDGIVFDKKIYYARCSLENLNVRSNGVCIKFDNTAYSVYECYFEHMLLDSQTKSCIVSATHNKSTTSNEQLVFSCVFNDISCITTEYAIENISGLGCAFKNIYDGGNFHKGVFRNCSGYFDNVNTSFGGCEYFLLIDDIYNFGLKLYMNNVNAESITKGFIKNTDAESSFTSITLIDTSFTNTSEDTRTEPPISVYNNIIKLTLNNASVFDNFPTNYDASVKAPIVFKSNSLPTSISSDVDVAIYNINGLYNYSCISATNEYLGSNLIMPNTSKYFRADMFQGGFLGVNYDSKSDTYFDSLFKTSNTDVPYPSSITFNFSEIKYLDGIVLPDFKGTSYQIVLINNGTANIVTQTSMDENTIEPGNSAVYMYMKKAGTFKWVKIA